MYKIDIRVIAQVVEENYNWAQGGDPYWKNKGGTEFVIPQVDSDSVMYAAPGEAEVVIQSMLDDQSGYYMKFTLIDWEIIWAEPVVLSTNVFNNRMNITVE